MVVKCNAEQCRRWLKTIVPSLLTVYVFLFAALCSAETDIEYRTGPGGGQIIDLDDADPERRVTGEQGGRSRFQRDTPRPQASTPRPPPGRPGNEVDWEKLGQSMETDPFLKPFTEQDARRLRDENEQKQALQRKKETHQANVREKRQNRIDFKEKMRKNLSGDRPGRKAGGRVKRPSANDLDLMMEKLTDPGISKANKQRITAVLFVHQDIYRNAVSEGFFGRNTVKVKEFLKWKKQMQADVIYRMGMKYRQKYGEPLKAPVIPFGYNSIASDDDIITGSGKIGAIMENLYTESLDEIIRERAGRPMGAQDRQRVDVNGLAWDMTQEGALDNYWHKEKYINPQSGYANQQKLLSAGDDINVYTFDDSGHMVKLHGTAAREAIKRLAIDAPLKIPGIDTKAGTGTISDYLRMADIHQIRFASDSVTREEIQQFIRNQKYTDRVDKNFSKIAADQYPEIQKKHAGFIAVSRNIRDASTIEELAHYLQKEYKVAIVLKNNIVDYNALEKAMRLHQGKQLYEVLPKMFSAVTGNEAYKMAKWMKGASAAARRRLRKQLAITYSSLDRVQRRVIVDDLKVLDIADADKKFLLRAVTDDAAQIAGYVKLMGMSHDEFIKHVRIDGDNHGLVAILSKKATVKPLYDALQGRPGVSRFKAFLETTTARALNLDVMLDFSKENRKGAVMQWSMIMVAVGRAYNAGSDQTDAFRKMGAGLFEMVPGVAAVLRFSEQDFRSAFEELAMDLFPPAGLAYFAGTMLKYSATYTRTLFDEAVWEGLASEVLVQLTPAEEYFVASDIGDYYRLQNRTELLQYLDEVSPALGRIAKLSSLVEPDIEARMERHPDVKINNAAIEMIRYFNNIDIVGIQLKYRPLFDLKQLKAKVYENGIPGEAELSPAVRVAARIILDNLRIRKTIYYEVLDEFINRVENRYNRLKGGRDRGMGAIVYETMLKLREIYDGAPDSIRNSPVASELLTEGYRERVRYLSDYKDTKQGVELKREMQALLDGFRDFIRQLAAGVALFQEQRALALTAYFYGGDTSMVPLSAGDYLLSGDTFRLGISAKVQANRRSLKWTAYYYLRALGQGPPRLVLLGQRELKPSRYNPRAAGLWPIVAPDKDSFIHIRKSQLEKYFWNPKIVYEVFPVMAFGNWRHDPVAEVGITALLYPNQYPEMFSRDKVAFIGAALQIRTQWPMVSVDAPQYIYRDEVAKVYVSVDLPHYYADSHRLDGKIEVYPPEKGAAPPDASPNPITGVSAARSEQSSATLSFSSSAVVGQYVLRAYVELPGLSRHWQPVPAQTFFWYLDEDRPEESEESGDEERDAGIGATRVAEARATIEACDYTVMARLIEGLEALDPAPPEAAPLIADLRREINADTAFTAASKLFIDGDLDAAERDLTAADTTQCKERRAKVSEARDRIERLRRVLERVDAVLTSCALDADHLAEAEALRSKIAAKDYILLREATAALGRMMAAVNAFNKAKHAYLEGDVDAADAYLNVAELPECADYSQRIVRRRKHIATLREVFGRVNTVISSCEPAAAPGLHERLLKTRFKPVVEARVSLEHLIAAHAHNKASKQAYFDGHLKLAAKRLDDARAKLDRLGAGVCPELRATIKSRQARIKGLRKALRAADAVIRDCKPRDLQAMLTTLSGDSHVLVKQKLTELRAALSRCSRKKREKPVVDIVPAVKAGGGTRKSDGGDGDDGGPGATVRTKASTTCRQLSQQAAQIATRQQTIMARRDDDKSCALWREMVHYNDVLQQGARLGCPGFHASRAQMPPGNPCR